MTDNLLILRAISFVGIFVLCAIAWIFSENRSPRVFPWRLMLMGILLQLAIGALVFVVPGTNQALQIFSSVLDSLFIAADFGARFVFGSNIVPAPGQDPAVDLGYIFAFRALPTVIFFSGLMGLLYNLGIIQIFTNFFAKIFYSVMGLSGAESLSGAANIFVGIEAAIVVKPFLAKMTRSELCAILACCYGTTASSTLAIYAGFLRPVFPNILGHLVSASILSIPACFVLSKILVPETEVPLTAGRVPDEKELAAMSPSSVGGDAELRDGDDIRNIELVERPSPLDAAISGALDGVKMAVAIAAVLIIILGLVSLINQFFAWLALLPAPIGSFFQVVTLANIAGVLFLPFTALTGVSLEWQEIWQSSVIIGRRLLETAIPPFQALSEAAALPESQRVISDRAVLIVSYALSGFAHIASVGIFVGGTIAMAPSRRRDLTELGWKALFIGTLATLMTACVAGALDTGASGILGIGQEAPLTAPAPSPTESPEFSPSPTEPESPALEEVPEPEELPDTEESPSPAFPTPSPTPPAGQSPTPSPSPEASPSPTNSPLPPPPPSPNS